MTDGVGFDQGPRYLMIFPIYLNKTVKISQTPKGYLVMCI
jgi:hypothetical protein